MSISGVLPEWFGRKFRRKLSEEKRSKERRAVRPEDKFMIKRIQMKKRIKEERAAAGVSTERSGRIRQAAAAAALCLAVSLCLGGLFGMKGEAASSASDKRRTAVRTEKTQDTVTAGVKLLSEEAADTVQAGLFDVLNNNRTRIINYAGASQSDEGVRYMSMAGGQERASVWSVSFQLPKGTKADGKKTAQIAMTLKNAMAGRTLRTGESLQAFYDNGNGVYYKVPTSISGDVVLMSVPVLTATDSQYLILVITSGFWRPTAGYDYLAIGNSITMHPRQSYWPDAMGMGATTQDLDYFHLVSSALQTSCAQKGLFYNSAAFNYAIWEIEFGKRQEVLYLLDPYLSPQLELVTIQLGENAIPDATGFAVDFPVLVQYIRAKAPKAKIVLVGNFWNNAVEETVKKQCAAAYGLTYVDLSAISVDPYDTSTKSPYLFGSELALDANGVGHSCSKEAVALHPNNAGMQYIAQSILQALGE